jgi:PAS domain S-box-containing protein
MTKSIVGKLTLFVGVLVGLNTALLIGAAYVTTSAILRDQVRDRLTAIADDRQEILLHELRQQQARAATFGEWPRIRSLFAADAGRNGDQAGGFLGMVRSHTAGLLALWIEDGDGRVLAASDPQGVVAELAAAGRPAPDAGEEGWLAVPPRRIAGLYAGVFCGAVRDDDGRRLGNVCLAADLGAVMTFVGDPHALGDSGEVLVGWKRGDRIYLPLPPRGDPRLTEVSAAEFPSLNAAISGEFDFAPTTDYRGRDVLVAYRPLGMGYPNWGLIAKLDTDEAYEPVSRLRGLLLAIGGGLLVLGLGASNAIARRVARPIKRLARTAGAVAAGDLTVRSEVASSDEIGDLGLAFNRMTEELERSYAGLEGRIAERTDALAHSELALREQTRILQSVLDCMGDGVVVADAAGRFLIFNPAARRILGHAPVDAPRGEWSRHYEIFLPDRVTPFPSMDLPLNRAIGGESVDQAELYIGYPSREDGTWILVTGRPLRDERGMIEGGVVVFHDITRRKKAERRLAAQYETTRVLAEADSLSEAGPRILETIGTSLDWDLGALWRVDAHAHRLRCAAVWIRPGLELSRFATVTWGIELERGARLPGRVWAEAAPEWIPDIAEDPEVLRAPAAAAAGLHAGFAVPIRLQGDCLGVLEFFSREVRPVDPATLDMMASIGSQIGQFLERQQMRTRVSQSEKLASLGMLSAGVAHEINNPLAYIANNLAVLDRDSRFLFDLLTLYEQGRPELSAARPDLVDRVDHIADEFGLDYVRENLGRLLNSTRQGVKRVADIVQNLRGFARLDRAEDHRADVHEAIRTALEMVRGRLDRRGIGVDEQFDAVPQVAGSPAQLNQVFLNLLVNALQAIEETHRVDGRIAIATVAIDGEVVVDVSDNGCGIPGDVLPHIFDPFFTTKGVGDGTGLGLSITHGMVHDQGGRLEVESTLGEGTRFRVILAAAGT